MDQEIKKIILRVEDIELLFYATAKNKDVNHIFKEIFKIDVYHLQEKEFKKNDVIIDIGANIGIFSIYLAKKHPDIIIYAFEPSTINYELFLKNIKENNINNIKPYNLAVHKDSKSELTLNYLEEYPGSSSFHNKGNTKDKVKTMSFPDKVQTISFDDIILKNNLDKIQFLKIDCEGSEYDIIYNSKKFSDNLVENLAIEIHDIPNENKKELVKYIFKIINSKKINYTFPNPPLYFLFGKNKKQFLDSFLGKMGLVLKKISPNLYGKMKKIKEKYIKTQAEVEGDIK